MASARNLTLASAAILVLLLSMEASHVDAQSCDSNSILTALASCFQYQNNPGALNKQTSCCSSVVNIYNGNNRPSDTCMCTTTQSVAGAGVTKQNVINLISVCMDPSKVPACLKS